MVHVHEVMEWLAVIIDLTGALIMFWAFVSAVVGAIKNSFGAIDVRGKIQALQIARCGLGAKLVFALELMIVSDLLQTIISRSIDDLIFLGGLVVIRTTIAYFLNQEIKDVEAELARAAD